MTPVHPGKTHRAPPIPAKRPQSCLANGSNVHLTDDDDDDDDDDCFYIALFSALEQTHCACMQFYMND